MAISLVESPLPPNVNPAETIVMWGAPRSGKSGFIGCLYGLHKSKTAGPHWTAHPKDALTPETGVEMRNAYSDLCSGGYRKTDVRELEPLHLTIRKKEQGRQIDSVPLFLVDPAGEVVTTPMIRDSSIGTEVHRVAAQSRGLVWLISADRAQHNRTETQAAILPELISLLEASRGVQIETPVAICLSMIDKLPEQERLEALADPRKALATLIGAAVPKWFEALCPRLRYFAVSARGLTDGSVEPINVSEVLDWIVAESRVKETPARSWWRFAKPALALTALGMLGWGGTVVATAPSTNTRAAPPPTVSTPAPPLLTSPPSATTAPAIQPAVPADSVRAPITSRARGASKRISDSVWQALTAAIDAAPAGARSSVPQRYARAHACITSQLACDESQVRADYSWVRGYGTMPQRAEAKRALDSMSHSPRQTR